MESTTTATVGLIALTSLVGSSPTALVAFPAPRFATMGATMTAMARWIAAMETASSKKGAVVAAERIATTAWTTTATEPSTERTPTAPDAIAIVT